MNGGRLRDGGPLFGDIEKGHGEVDNFTPIRNGIWDHIRGGKLCPFDLGIYVFLHLRADWATGIYHGCALTIAHGFNDPSIKLHINKALMRLRDRQYINYPKGNGTRGAYPVLIHKYDVTVGELSGTRLNAWKHGHLAQPEYEAWNGRGRMEQQWRKSGGRVEEPIQDFNQDLLDLKTKTKARSVAEAPSLPDWLPIDPWTGFLEMRKKKGANPTNRAVSLLLKKLEQFRTAGDDPAAILDQSTRNNWTDIYPIKGASNGKPSPGDVARNVYEREREYLNKRTQ